MEAHRNPPPDRLWFFPVRLPAGFVTGRLLRAQRHGPFAFA
jgi:hypothetical protein